MSEKLKAKFGDLIENGWASDANPTRTGYFVREFRRPHGRMNAGLTWEVTDGKGKFWELSPTGDHKITVTPARQDEAKAASPDHIADAGKLVEAARAVVERWETPKWKDAEHTGVLIGRLREAIEGQSVSDAYPLDGIADPRDARIAALTEALKPFADVSAKAKGADDACWCGQDGAVIRYRDLRRAASLQPKEPDQ